MLLINLNNLNGIKTNYSQYDLSSNVIEFEFFNKSKVNLIFNKLFVSS